MKEHEIGKQLNLVKEAIDDWSSGELTDLTTIIIIKRLINKKKPSTACLKWAKKVLNKRTE